MDSIHLGGGLRQVVYVDASVVSGGDGLTPATALNELPLPSAWTGDTVYYLRRGQTALTLGETNVRHNLSAINGVYVIGAPPVGSELHQAAPQAAKDAWDADAGVYALVTPNGSTEVRFTMANAGVAHIDYRVPAAGVSAYDYDMSFWRFDAPSSTPPAGWFFNYNRFSVEGVDFADDQYLTPWNGGVLHCCWMYNGHSPWTGYGEMIGNVLNLSLGSANYYGMGDASHGLRMEQLGRGQVRDNVFHLGTFGGGYGGGSAPALYVRAREVDVRNNTGRVVVQQSGQETARLPCMYVDGWKVLAEDNDWRVHRYFGEFSDAYVYGGTLIAVNQSPHYETPGWLKVKNLYADAGKFINVSGGPLPTEYGYGVVMIATSGRNRADSYVKDITALVDRTGFGNPAGAAFSFRGLDCLPNPVTGIVAKHYQSYGLGGNHYNSGDAPLPFYTRSNYILGYMEVDVLEGRVGVENLGHLHVKSMTVPTPNPAILASNSSIHVDELVFDAARWTEQQAVRASRSQVVVERCNVPFLWSWMSLSWSTGTNDRTYFIGCNGDGGYEGRWVGSGGFYEGKAWNTTREGGAPAALKLWGNALDARMPLQIGLEGFRALQAASAGVGEHILTVYAAHKLIGNPALLPATFRLYVRVPVGADDWREYCSSIHGAWLNDTSVWHEGDGSDTLTARRWELPFTLDAEAFASGRALDIRAEYDHYDPQGYLYFDPQLALEAIDTGGVQPFSLEAPIASRLTLAPAVTEAEVSAADSNEPETLYFVTSRDRYHLPGCTYAESGVPMSREQLIQRDAIPCGHCQPPALS